MEPEPEVEHVHDDLATPESVVALLRGLTRLIQDFLHERAKAAGLNSTDFIALIRIADSDGMTGAQLGGGLGMTSSSTTGLADRLQSAGLIRRVAHVTDRRVALLLATARGRALVEREIGPLLEGLVELLEGLDQPALRTVAELLAGIDGSIRGAANRPTTARRRRASKSDR